MRILSCVLMASVRNLACRNLQLMLARSKVVAYQEEKEMMV